MIRPQVTFKHLKFFADPHLLSLYGEIFVREVYFHNPSFRPKPGMRILDIGAQEGLFSIYCAAQGAKVVAVEPNPDSRKMFSQHCKLNNIEDIHCIPFALGDKNSIVLFEKHTREGSGSSKVIQRAVDSAIEGEIIKIEMKTLDALFSELNLPIIDLVKIDVEGCEIQVLKGAKMSLHKCQRVVMECENSFVEQAIEIMSEAEFTLVDKFHSVLYFMNLRYLLPNKDRFGGGVCYPKKHLNGGSIL